MDKSHNDKSRYRQFSDASNVWGSLIKSYSFVCVD